MRKVLFLALVGGLIWLPGTASADPTTGTWTQYPEPSNEYLAEVQPPLSGANTSNWPSKSKGGIPVMYHLLARQGAAVFQSNLDTDDTSDDFAFMSFDPDPDITFADIHTLSTNYAFDAGDCGGGALRWSVTLDVGNDGDPTNNRSIFIYYGELPNFTDCTTTSQSGDNMINQTDMRYDTSQLDAVFYNTYAKALEDYGSLDVVRASLVIDAGWFDGPQVLSNITSVTVNDNVIDFDTGGTNGDFTRTCDLPDAWIEVTTMTPAPGSFSEATVYAQPTILASDQFRVVDCMYQYVLSIPSLDGPGTYDVELLIDGSPVATEPDPPSEVSFELR